MLLCALGVLFAASLPVELTIPSTPFPLHGKEHTVTREDHLAYEEAMKEFLIRIREYMNDLSMLEHRLMHTMNMELSSIQQNANREIASLRSSERSREHIDSILKDCDIKMRSICDEYNSRIADFHSTRTYIRDMKTRALTEYRVYISKADIVDRKALITTILTKYNQTNN